MLPWKPLGKNASLFRACPLTILKTLLKGTIPKTWYVFTKVLIPKYGVLGLYIRDQPIFLFFSICDRDFSGFVSVCFRFSLLVNQIWFLFRIGLVLKKSPYLLFILSKQVYLTSITYQILVRKSLVGTNKFKLWYSALLWPVLIKIKSNTRPSLLLDN